MVTSLDTDEPGMWHLHLANPRALAAPIPFRAASASDTYPATSHSRLWKDSTNERA